MSKADGTDKMRENEENKKKTVDGCLLQSEFIEATRPDYSLVAHLWVVPAVLRHLFRYHQQRQLRSHRTTPVGFVQVGYREVSSNWNWVASSQH